MTTRRRTDTAKGSTARHPGTRRAPAPHERQRDPERTKARIVEAAIEEFSAKGFAGARVSEIASRAGVNQQLIAYYFDGKEGLYQELGRRWWTYQEQALPDDLDLAETIKHYVRASADPRLGAKLLAWEGLADTGADGEQPDQAAERAARFQHEAQRIRQRQQDGELDDSFDPAALVLITLSAANALTVYPQLARDLFGADGTSPELVERYAQQLAHLIQRLSARPDHPG